MVALASKEETKKKKKTTGKNKKTQTKKESRKKKKVKLSSTMLKDIVPFGNIQFKSDYFRTGLYYGAILTFMTEEGSVVGLPPMWGYRLIPFINDKDVVARLVTSFQSRPSDWVEARALDAADITTGTMSDAQKAGQTLELEAQRSRHLSNQIMMQEISSGASYLDTTYKIVLYAPSRQQLDVAINQLNQLYQSRFGSAQLTQYYGQQQDDYRNLLAPATTQLGMHDGYTSTELAGFYPFLGKGWLDKKGEYVGKMAGDINESPVLWDSETIRRLAVVASNGNAYTISDRQPRDYSGQAGWLTYIAQRSLLAGRNVFELVLNNEDISKIGYDLSNSSSFVPMDQGMINPLQAFGEAEDELQLYAILSNKIKSMLIQLNSDLTRDDLTLVGNVLDDFFIKEGLWSINPQHNRDKLRLVGLRDNNQVPTIGKLIPYIANAWRAYDRGTGNTPPNANMAARYLSILNMFKPLQDTYGHLFDTVTTFDDARITSSPRKIFAFGELQRQGVDVLMAQFINVLSYVVSRMKKGDCLHIYGAEMMSDIAWEFLNQQTYFLRSQGIRLVLGFTDTTSALNSPFFGEADTTILGSMSDGDRDLLRGHISGNLPTAVADETGRGDDRIYYLRRGGQNAVFFWDAVF